MASRGLSTSESRKTARVSHLGIPRNIFDFTAPPVRYLGLKSEKLATKLQKCTPSGSSTSQNGDVRHTGTQRTPEAFEDAEKNFKVLAMRETGGHNQRCKSSQDCENASIPAAFSEKSFDQKVFTRAFRSDAKASTWKGPQADDKAVKAISEMP